ESASQRSHVDDLIGSIERKQVELDARRFRWNEVCFDGDGHGVVVADGHVRHLEAARWTGCDRDTIDADQRDAWRRVGREEQVDRRACGPYAVARPGELVAERLQANVAGSALGRLREGAPGCEAATMSGEGSRTADDGRDEPDRATAAGAG